MCGSCEEDDEVAGRSLVSLAGGERVGGEAAGETVGVVGGVCAPGPHKGDCRERGVAHRFDQKWAFKGSAVLARVGFVSSLFCSEMVSNVTGTAKLTFSISFSIALVWPCCAPNATSSAFSSSATSKPL